MPKKVVCLGEIMLRLSAPDYLRFVQAETFEATYGGGEANVSVSLANFGLDSYFVSKVPNSPLGQASINHLRRFGVTTNYVLRGGSRLGVYFLENGASQRPSKVIYDRTASAIAEAKPEEFDWEEIFAKCAWFHVTGITPAISEKAAILALEASKVAHSMGCTVSLDINYRKNLWTPQKANEVMSLLMKYVDVCIGNEEDAEKVFGIKARDTDILTGKLSKSSYRDVAIQLMEKFGLKIVAITLRESLSASDNGWSGLLYDGKEFFDSRAYSIRIVDRVGGGDSFASGLIYGLLSGKDHQSALEFAVAASCLKHTIKGDFNMVSSDEVEYLANGDASGRVQR